MRRACYDPELLKLKASTAADYLAARGAIGPFKLSELAGGVSNIVLLVETGAERYVLKQSLPRLRVAQEWYSDRSRIFRECDALRTIAGLWPRGWAPEVLFEDREQFLFAMTAAPSGATPWNEELMRGLGRR